MGQVLSVLKRIASAILSLSLFQVTVPAAVLIIIFALSVFLGTSIVRGNPDMFGLLKGPEIIRQEEKRLVAKVGEIIDLPEDEEPTVATVTDPSQLTNQQFFSKAIEGDKLIIYPNSGKAILYRASEDRVVEVGSINRNEQQEVVNLDVGNPVRFVILNGTNSPGLTNKIEEDLKSLLPEAQIVSKSNATNSSYEESLLIDLSDGRVDIGDLADKLGVFKTKSLPEGELRPEGVDYVIIAGSDKATPAPTQAPEVEE